MKTSVQQLNINTNNNELDFLFHKNKIRTLSDSNFTIVDNNLILDNININIILFYDNTNISKHIVEMFENTAENIMGPIFCKCNISQDIELKNKLHNFPFILSCNSQYSVKDNIPFIIVYKDSKPQLFFTGSFDQNSIMNFCLSVVNLRNIDGLCFMNNEDDCDCDECEECEKCNY